MAKLLGVKETLNSEALTISFIQERQLLQSFMTKQKLADSIPALQAMQYLRTAYLMEMKHGYQEMVMTCINDIVLRKDPNLNLFGKFKPTDDQF